MSATSVNEAPAKEAPWKKLFVKHLESMPSPEFVAATLAPAPSASASASASPQTHDASSSSSSSSKNTTQYLPRARFLIWRGMFAEMPENKHNEHRKNPRVYASEMPMFTTDVRMQKVDELFMTSPGRATSHDQCVGSGGGGPIEAVWWVNVPPNDEGGENTVGIKSQWRIRGEAFVIGPDIETKADGEDSSGVRTVKSQLGSRMRIVDEAKLADWSWDLEMRALFANQSPGIRASFKHPPPGQDINKRYDDKLLKFGQKVETLDDKVAREHFRCVVIKPSFVEQVDLNMPGESRRYAFFYDESTKEWKEEEQWP